MSSPTRGSPVLLPADDEDDRRARGDAEPGRERGARLQQAPEEGDLARAPLRVVSTFEEMALPPRSFGPRRRAVRLERVGERRWRVAVDERPLSPAFASECEARDAAAAEVERLDAVSVALLRRIRSGLNRKRG